MPEVSEVRTASSIVAMPAAEPSAYVRGQHRGYLDIDGVAPGSQTETHCAMRLGIENWRWSGVPVFIRADKCMPVTVTELRVFFAAAPARLRAEARAAPRTEPARAQDQAGPHDQLVRPHGGWHEPWMPT